MGPFSQVWAIGGMDSRHRCDALGISIDGITHCGFIAGLLTSGSVSTNGPTYRYLV
jgi:hypothetical protein